MRRKDILELGLTACLVMVLLIAVGGAIKRAQQKKRQEAKKADKALRQEASFSVQDASLFEKLQGQSASLAWKVDPFTGLMFPPSVPETILSGILWDKDRPMAIIDDQIVAKGDTVDGKTVADIREDRVILNDGTKDTELILQ